MKNGMLALIVVLAVLAGVGVSMFVGQKFATVETPSVQTSAGGAGAQPYISTGATTLSFTTLDGQSQGTSVGTTNYISIGNDNSYQTGITSASPNDVINVLFVNNSQYHNAVLNNFKVLAQPSQTATVLMNRNGSVTISLFNEDNQKMSIAQNQTVVTGGAYNLNTKFSGTDKTNTQDMKCVLESSDGTKADKATLSGAGATFVGTSKPSSYTLSGTSSQVWVYDVQPQVGSATIERTLSVTSKVGQSLAGTSIKISCFTKEYFIDPNSGKVVYDTEDSNGALKSIATYTATGYFQ